MMSHDSPFPKCSMNAFDVLRVYSRECPSARVHGDFVDNVDKGDVWSKGVELGMG